MSAIARGVLWGLGLRAAAAVAVTAVGAVATNSAVAQTAGINEVLIQSGAAAPDGNGTFADFGLSPPIINNVGQVVFFGNLTGTSAGASDDEGLYRVDGTTVVQVFRTRPSNLLQAGYSEIGFQAINDSGTVAITAKRRQPLVGAEFRPTLFQSAGGVLAALSSAGQTPPDGIGEFTVYSSPVINSAGNIAFLAEHTNPAAGADDLGIYYRNGAILTQIVREGDPAPDNDGVIDWLVGLDVNDNGQVAFSGNVSGSAGGAHDGNGVFRGDVDGVVQIARAGQPAPDLNGQFAEFANVFYSTPMNESGHVVFRATLAGTAGGTSDNRGLYYWDGVSSTQVARTGQTNPDGNVITSLYGIQLNNVGQAVFAAGVDVGGTEKAVIYRSAGTELTLIARDGQAVPGGNGSFHQFGGLYALNDAGHVLFLAVDIAGTSGGTADDQGIYLGNGIDVIEVARKGRALAGSTITDVHVNPGGVFTSGRDVDGFSETSQVAYDVELANGKTAIVRFTIPDVHWTAPSSGVWSGVNFTNGILPNSFHHVFIDPATASPSVLGRTTDFHVRSLTIGSLTSGVSTLRITNGGDLTSLEAVTINQRGKIEVGPGHTLAAPMLVNRGQLVGGGRIDATLTNAAGGYLSVAGGQTLEIAGQGTHSNSGAMWAASGELHLVNPLVQSSGGEVNVLSGALRLDGGMTNNGRLSFDAAGNEIYGDLLNAPAGLVSLAPGAEADFFGDVNNAGLFEVRSGATATFHGLFAGLGVAMDGDVEVLGDVRPSPVAALMEFGGDLSFGPMSRLQIELGGLNAGTDHDSLLVAGRAALGGELEITPLIVGGAPFEPQPGNRFRILEAAAVNNQFSSLTVSGFAPGLKFALEYRADEVVLATEALFSADFNLDGDVDGDDLAALKSHYGALGASHAQGDADGNGVVDGADLLAWQRQVGASLKVAAAIQAIPEPASGALAGWLVLAALAARQSGRR